MVIIAIIMRMVMIDIVWVSVPSMILLLRCWIPNPGVPCSKPLGFDSAFHPSKVSKMSTRNFWELSGKKLPASRSGSSLEAGESHPEKGAIKFFF